MSIPIILCIFVSMIIDKHIDKDNWNEIKDILPDIIEIKSLDLSWMQFTELPKMSHITVTGFFNCSHNKITSFKDCPIVNGNLYCFSNQITSFKDCPEIGGYLYSDFKIFDKVQKYSKEMKISLLEAQLKLYNQQNKKLLTHLDKFPDLVAYIRLKELNKLL